MNLAEFQEREVLSYHERERNGVRESEPLAGLSLAVFRAARARLVEKGQLVRTPAGRYVPTGQPSITQEAA